MSYVFKRSAALFFLASACAAAQQAGGPAAQLISALAQASASLAPTVTADPWMPGGAQQEPAQPTGPSLTIAQAEQMAIRNNPNISVARLLVLAQAQVTREVRSAELPSATADLTAVGAHDNSRITAGLLNNPSVYDRAAGGLRVSQLITDFGRTHNLVLSAQSSAKAQLESERATELDITLTVDQAFYQALTAQAVLKVAQETVAQRQATVDQVGALTKAKIRSDLDLSFANVQLSQAKLLLLDAQNSQQSAMAALNNVLGSEQNQQYNLLDETNGNPPPAPDDAEALVRTAFGARPDLAAQNDKFIAARQFSTAQRDLVDADRLRNRCRRRHAGARRPDSVIVVRRRGGQHQHSRLQRLSLQRRSQGSQTARSSSPGGCA